MPDDLPEEVNGPQEPAASDELGEEPGTTLLAPNAPDEEAFQVPDSLPVLPLRDVVVYPGMMVPLIVSREQSVELVDHAVSGDKLITLVAQKSPETENPGPGDIYRMGTVGIVLKMLKFPDASVRLLVQGLNRVHVTELVQTEPYLIGNLAEAEEFKEASEEIVALDRTLNSQFQQYLEANPQAPQELQVILMNIDDPGRRADIVASTLGISLQEKQEILEILSVRERLHKVSSILGRELDLAELSSKLQGEVQDEINKNQREYFLREKLKAIRKELGETDEREAEIQELREKLEEANPPKEAREEAEREIARIEKMPPGSAEHTVARTYLDWIITLPWAIETEDSLEIEKAEEVLNHDHAGLNDVKERILEYLAVRRLKRDMKGPILCFAGPPGVGKTSLGKSIARALGRKFVRISLGGVRDEAEIRGHRRTYVGALPGRIIQGIRKAGSNNPLFMLDEIDKLGSDFRGDPSSALLEVLDPEQNNTFSDHYLDVPFDLSKVMFITTANVLAAIPGPLRDRMEVLTIPGYTLEEKTVIAKGYLIPRQLEGHGLDKKDLRFDPSGIRKIIQEYTREAGVRNLEREIANCCRKTARKKASSSFKPVRLSAGKIPDLLGPRKFFQEIAEKSTGPGIVTGLAWTETGGEILFIESSKMPGKKGFKLTGQLGDVMKESGEAALSYIRSHSGTFNIDPDFFEQNDIHVHVPAGAIPKDGPSAGVAMTLSLLSLILGKPVRPTIAMTGEITLRGRVMPVGGIKEKVLAAYRAGIKTILLPARNENDLENIPEEIRKKLDFHPCESIEQVIEVALPTGDKTSGRKKKKTSNKKRKAS